MFRTTNYGVASKGFQTSYPANDTPPDYCLQFRNMHTNTIGNAEKRQGITQFNDTIASKISVTNVHFLVSMGTELVFASGQGEIWLLNESTGAWTQVYHFGDTSAKIFSFFMSGKLIFYNGVNRNVYTTDGSSFFELLSVLEGGVATSVTAPATTDENHLANLSTVPNWTVTDVAQYSIVYYPRASAYAAVLSVVSAVITHSAVSAASLGVGAGSVPVSGSPYTIIDTLALNILPVSGAQINELDNEGALTSGSNTSTVRFDTVSDFTLTEARVDDFVYNETRQALSQITTITTSSLGIVPITGQTVGDDIILLKSSQPICAQGVAHQSRAFMIDARDNQKVRISGPVNPQDFGSSLAATLDVGAQQSDSQTFLTLLSWQRFLVVAGTKNTFFFEGSDPSPVSANAAGPVDFQQIGMFPVGVLSRTGLVNVGNDVYMATINGVRRATLSKSTAQLVDASVSFQIDKTLRELLKKLPQDDIVMFHYAKRSWMGVKAGSEVYIFNYVAAQAIGGTSDERYSQLGAWHLFDGNFANQGCYSIRENGDMLTGSVAGVVGVYDQNVYSDFGQPIKTVYQTGWNTMEKSNRAITRKQGKAIRPIFKAGADINLTVSVIAPFANQSTDTVVVSAATGGEVIGGAIVGQAIIGGNDITDTKAPLRWHGEQARFTFTTESTTGPFVLSNFNVFWIPGSVE